MDYVIEVEEDVVAEAKIEKKSYKAPTAETKKTTGKYLLTQELKNMSVDELGKSDKYKEVLEARELEDCLYNWEKPFHQNQRAVVGTY